MSDYVYESGLSTKRRRQRRTAITLLLALLLLFSAFWWAWSYIRDGDSGTVVTSAPTISPGECVDAKDVTINIYNATNRTGLARTSADALSAAGFTIGTVANWPGEYGVESFGTIRFGPAAEEAATGFVEHYGQPVLLRPIQREGIEIDIVLGDAFDDWVEFPDAPAC